MTDTFRLLTEAEITLLDDTQLGAYVAALEAYKTDLADAWLLNPRQEYAEQLAHQVDELLYGGAAGGGKTEWALWHLYHELQRYPNVRALYLRNTFPELYRTAIVRSLHKFDSDVAHFRVGRKEWQFTNGSVLEFGFLESYDDVFQYDSAEYMIIVFDELTQFTKETYDFLQGRLRITVAARRLGARPHTISMSNPGGVGHVWVRDWFVLPTNYGNHVARFEAVEGDPSSEITVGFVPAFVDDNPHVDEDYKRRLMRLPTKLRQQRLYGDWDIFEGMYFDEFNRDIHVCEPFEVPDGVPRIAGVDWGYRDPFCVVWAFVLDGTLYVYRDLKITGLSPHEQVERVKALETDADGNREKVDYYMADPSTAQSRGPGDSTHVQWMRAGWTTLLGDNRRVDGWNHLRELLRLDEHDQPGIVFFSTCFDLIKDLTGLTHDSTKPEDVHKHADDHLPDALRYMAMSRPRRRMPRDDRDMFPSNLDDKARMDLARLQSQRRHRPDGEAYT